MLDELIELKNTMLFDGIMVDLPAQKLKSESASVNFSFTPIYPPKLRADGGFIALRCELPEDAILGDVVALSASALDARFSNFSAQITLTQHHITHGFFDVALVGNGEDGEYDLQLNLYGKHNAIKNSNSFSVVIKNTNLVCAHKLNSALSQAWSNRFIIQLKNTVSAVFSKI